ncbi:MULTISPECIES: hypothetical protein [Lacticaseibacillus]|jgi:hypothetical protein|uniref:Uncharacterized protein n=3 Tax=Lacticaseibacillus TaxID=2759736 RepID=A0AAN1C5Z7_LACCA|nr:MULTISPECIES: hypothetical protein [Lacticaseibacillus]ARY90411.1 hypothetical protein BGL52_01000 [Lacticaseibacillus casei]KAB1969844.1 hypothetical protein F9B82_05620 [Lacticaseibacillus casei]MDG3062230.1 hypothetical protein [Lacticaseibacillus sp. BCRC 81376]QVI36235.1 hypothetical protein KGS74_08160 [Lacticaseibacillus casei]QXG58032.1 hypothetical protein KTT66_07395 [Lacticaseibacillus casei]
MSNAIRLTTLAIVSALVTTPLIESVVPVQAAEVVESTTVQNTPEAGKTIVARTEIQRDFLAMQDEITNQLDVLNGKYVYDFNTIEKIVEKFDFATLNKETGSNFSAKNFLTVAINDINSTRLPRRTKRGRYYNYNGTAEGWNYRRSFYDTWKSKAVAQQLNNAARDFGYFGPGIGGALALAAGPVGAAMGAAFAGSSAFTSWYAGGLASSITYNNTGAGVVVDINKYTQAYSVFDQKKF